MENVRISDVGNIITGKTPQTSIAQNYAAEIPFVTPADFNNQKFIRSTQKMISTLGLETIKNCFLPSPAVCVTCIGSDMGKVGVTQMACVTNQQINSIIPNKEFDIDYIYYAIKYISPIIKSMGETSTAVPIVNKTDFSNFLIPCPKNKGEQKRIAELMNCYDIKIEQNEKHISVLHLLIRAIYQNWFSDFNHPDATGEMQNGIPVGWASSTVFENVNEVREKNKDNLDYPVLSVVKDGEFKLSDDVFTKQVYSKSTTNYKIIKRNQVGYNPARANIGSIAMLTDFDAGLVIPIYIVFEMMESITPTFFYYYMKQPMFVEGVKHHAIGTTRQNFPFEAFKMFPLVVPPIALQKRFEDIINPIEQKIAKLKEENAVLAEIRDTLLPRLISGELSVEVGEA